MLATFVKLIIKKKKKNTLCQQIFRDERLYLDQIKPYLPARMHFWLLTARVSLAKAAFGSTVPRKIGLNCAKYHRSALVIMSNAPQIIVAPNGGACVNTCMSTPTTPTVQFTWFIPELAKSKVGSSSGMVEELGTKVCPFFSKYVMNAARTRFILQCRSVFPIFACDMCEICEVSEKKNRD